MKRLASLLALVVVCLTSACFMEPEGARRMQPHPEWRGWFDEVKECTGLRGSFDRIEWYVVPGGPTFETDDGTASGYWTGDHIYLPDFFLDMPAWMNDTTVGEVRLVRSDWLRTSRGIVLHEMIHFLRQRGGHPVPPYTICAPISTGAHWERENSYMPSLPS